MAPNTGSSLGWPSATRQHRWALLQQLPLLQFLARISTELNQFEIFSNLGKQKVDKVLFCNLKCKSLCKIIACLRNSLHIDLFHPYQFYLDRLVFGKSCLTEAKINNTLKGLEPITLSKPSLCCQDTRRIPNEQELSLGKLTLIFPP